VIRSAVGDRYVLEKMMAHGLNLGGEQSGHLILWDVNTTGDGLMAALELLRTMRTTGLPLSQLRTVLQKFPQSLVNLAVKERIPFAQIPGLNETIATIDQELHGLGRVVLRYSGTEAKIRILVETKNEADLAKITARVAEPILKHFGI
jgi:phosphoglucosamine mutase